MWRPRCVTWPTPGPRRTRRPRCCPTIRGVAQAAAGQCHRPCPRTRTRSPAASVTPWTWVRRRTPRSTGAGAPHGGPGRTGLSRSSAAPRLCTAGSRLCSGAAPRWCCPASPPRTPWRCTSSRHRITHWTGWPARRAWPRTRHCGDGHALTNRGTWRTCSTRSAPVWAGGRSPSRAPGPGPCWPWRTGTAAASTSGQGPGPTWRTTSSPSSPPARPWGSPHWSPATGPSRRAGPPTSDPTGCTCRRDRARTRCCNGRACRRSRPIRDAPP